MSSTSGAAETFERDRRRLLLLAYRICGTWADAEDVVQSVAAQWWRARLEVRSAAAWLTTTTVRRALDLLRARQRDDAYVGTWQPGPPEPAVALAGDPAAAAEHGAALTSAFLVLAEHLTPPQRAAVVLRALGYEHAEIADILDVRPAAARQHHSRGMRRLDELNGRDAATDPTLGLSRAVSAAAARETESLVEAFLAAARAGQVDRLAELLHDDVLAYQDGGGQVRAARRVIRGRSKVARFVAGLATLHGDQTSAVVVQIGGAPAVRLTLSGTTHVLTVQARDGRLLRLFDVCNPDKIAPWSEPLSAAALAAPAASSHRSGSTG